MPTTKKPCAFMAPAASIKHDQTKKSRPNNERFHVYSHKKQLKTYIQQTFDRVAVANTNWLITFIHCKKKTICSARRKVVNHMTIIIFRYTFNQCDNSSRKDNSSNCVRNNMPKPPKRALNSTKSF